MKSIKVLLISANPDGTSKLELDEEVREIQNKIRSSDYRESVKLISLPAVRPADLLQALNQHRPDVVHFSGHGNSSDQILLLSDNGQQKPVRKEALVALFQTVKDNIRLVVLNSCYSRPQAEAISKNVECTIGMSKAIGDKAAIVFSASLYGAIGFGRSIQEAFDQAKTALLLESISEDNTPELLVRDGIDASKMILVKPSIVSPSALSAEVAGHRLVDDDADRVVISANLHPSQALATLRQFTADIIDKHNAATTSSRAEVELVEAETQLKSHDLQNSRICFERIRNRFWDELIEPQRYRVKVGLADVAYSQGRSADAGSLLIEAKTHQPANEKARINEALGYELLGKLRQAFNMVDSMLISYPHSSSLLSCWIRTAPPDTPLEELKKHISAVTERDSEVNLALAIRTADLERFDEAESFSRRAIAENRSGPPQNHGSGRCCYVSSFVCLGPVQVCINFGNVQTPKFSKKQLLFSRRRLS